MDCSLPGSSVHEDSPGNTGVSCHALLEGIFPTQGWNPGLPHCRCILYQLRSQGNPRILEWVAYAFSRGSSQPRNRTGVSCIAGGFFTSWAKSSHTCVCLSRLQIQLILFFLYIPFSPSLYQHCFLRLSRLACVAQIDIQLLLCLESHNWFFLFISRNERTSQPCYSCACRIDFSVLSFQLFVIWSHLSFSTLHLIP